VNARDRIGGGPWYNALGDRVATDLDALHRPNAINRDNALTERGDEVKAGAVILTGSRPDGTAFPGGGDFTCANGTTSRGGHPQVGTPDNPHSKGANAWSSARASTGCAQSDIGGRGGGMLYCFAID
jgi:hypothetical protein